jgi:hypothetical protein
MPIVNRDQRVHLVSRGRLTETAEHSTATATAGALVVSLTPGVSMQQLPLTGRVIFCDWHGVLCDDPFWASIHYDTGHPLRAQLRAGMAAVFSTDASIAERWMTGQITSGEVIEQMAVKLRGRSQDSFLARRLDQDCLRMNVNTQLFEALRVLRSESAVVVATANMDCFARAFRRAHDRRRRGRPLGRTMADWAGICDDIISSSDIGALKEDAVAFFGPWLARHRMTFRNALLIDDRAANCAAFMSSGGTAVEWRMGTHDSGALVRILRAWISVPAAEGTSPAVVLPAAARSSMLPAPLAGPRRRVTRPPNSSPLDPSASVIADHRR